jgi:hypothetical protein
MNRWPPRTSFLVWTLVVGAILSQFDAPPLIIKVPWFVIWTALVLLVSGAQAYGLIGARALTDRGTRPIGAGSIVHSDMEDLERFPEVYPQDISYTPARIGPTERLEERTYV